MLVALNKNIQTLDLEGNAVTIPVDTIVYFDSKECVAFWNDIHFFLEHGEYLIMN